MITLSNWGLNNMRLGKIRNIVTEVTNTSDQIIVEAEAVFGGQAYTINRFGELTEALQVVSVQEWNDADFTPIQAIIDKYDVSGIQTITTAEYEQLNSYISTINQKLPVFLGIIGTMVEEQDPKTINIMLPESIKSIEDLDKFNKRLVDIFKRFNLAGEFEFKGFDKGTSWYEVLITAELLYRYFLACMAVAISVVHFKKTFYEAENSKLAYKAAVKNNEKTEAQFLKDVVAEKLESDITEVISEIEKTDGKTAPELHNQLVAATTELVKELGHGTEFHLSLNPPKYATENGGGVLKIDYSSMPKLESNEPKTLEAGQTKTEDKKNA